MRLPFGVSMAEIVEDERRERMERKGDQHLWHLHISYRRDYRPSRRAEMRMMRWYGASHGAIKHARDLMRQEEKAQARSL